MLRYASPDPLAAGFQSLQAFSVSTSRPTVISYTLLHNDINRYPCGGAAYRPEECDLLCPPRYDSSKAARQRRNNIPHHYLRCVRAVTCRIDRTDVLAMFIVVRRGLRMKGERNGIRDPGQDSLTLTPQLPPMNDSPCPPLLSVSICSLAWRPFAPEHLTLDDVLPAVSLAVILSIFAAPFMTTCHKPEVDRVLLAIMD